mgnify:FL=1
MRTLPTRLQFNPYKKTLTATFIKEGAPCKVHAYKVNDVSHEFARVMDCVQFMANEVTHEPTDKQDHVSIVS